ncbi:DUF7344 domain-containing protein [Halostella litorea]|uniref:DUF7344 domain-containing protein n=1 Tax=Halostella litorea TaxID=2528831 RepID=UPI0010919F10|nr:helix-turn-helix domain-containing protein [Halostella litorea]
MEVDHSRSETDGGDGELDRIGELFDALAEPARRRILERVDAADDALRVETLAGQLADGTEELPAVRASLAHVHLPKLNEYGIVEYDSDALAVESVPATGRALGLVGTASGDPDR